MSTYNLVQEPAEWTAVSGYIAQPEPDAYVAVSGFGEEPVVPVAVDTAPKTDTTIIREKESMTGMWILLALTSGAAGYMYWKLRKAGIPLTKPVSDWSDFGHSGRTYYGVFPHRRGYGHHRLSTGRFHFHPRRTY